MKKLLALTVVVLVAALAVFAGAPSEWAAAEVADAFAAGFVPESLAADYASPVTRGEFASLAVNYLTAYLGYDDGELAENVSAEGLTFVDCDDENVLLCAGLGIVYGDGAGHFLPDAPITREEAAAMLLRVYQTYSAGYGFSGGAGRYADKDKIADYAVSSVDFVTEHGVMKGVSEDPALFDPKGLYTREQAIVTFLRLSVVSDWIESRAFGRLKRKLTYEETVEEFVSYALRTVEERYDTAYGTVFVSYVGGTPHGAIREFVYFPKTGGSVALYANVPRENFFHHPKPEHIAFSEDGKTMTFDVSFSGRAVIQSGGEEVLHEAATYYFTLDLETAVCALTHFAPKDVGASEAKSVYEKRMGIIDKAVEEFFADESRVPAELLKRFDTPYGTVLYVALDMSREGNESWKRHALYMVSNEGVVSYITLGEPTLNKWGKNPPFETLTLTDFNGTLLVSVIYRTEDGAAEDAVFEASVNLVSLAVTSKYTLLHPEL